MRKQAIFLAALAVLSGCGGSSIEGNWQNNDGVGLTFRSGDSFTLRDTNGSTYSGKWREVGTGQVEVTLSGFMGLGGPEVCSYQISGSDPTNLFLNDCRMLQGIYHKQ